MGKFFAMTFAPPEPSSPGTTTGRVHLHIATTDRKAWTWSVRCGRRATFDGNVTGNLADVLAEVRTCADLLPKPEDARALNLITTPTKWSSPK